MDPSTEKDDSSISDQSQKDSSDQKSIKKKTVVRVLGFEMLAPEGLNNAFEYSSKALFLEPGQQINDFNDMLDGFFLLCFIHQIILCIEHDC